jgi:hypothetical protein
MITVLVPEPVKVTGLVTTTFSTYVPGAIVIVAPDEAAVIADWIELNAQPLAHTVFLAARAGPANTRPAMMTPAAVRP